MRPRRGRFGAFEATVSLRANREHRFARICLMLRWLRSARHLSGVSPVAAVWPVLRLYRQARSNGILPDIVCRGTGVLRVSQPVLEEVSLPLDSVISRGPTFPITEVFAQIEGLRKCDDPMKMIGHGEKDRPFPVAALFPKLDGFAQSFPDLRVSQLIQMSIPAIDRDEKRFLRRIDPPRHVVR